MRIKPNRISWHKANMLYEFESKEIVAVLESSGIEVLNILPAGSLRREKNTIGDIDIVIEVDNPDMCGKILEKELDYKLCNRSTFYKKKIQETGIDLFVAGKNRNNFYAMLFWLTGCEDWNLRITRYLKHNTKVRLMPFRFVNIEEEKILEFKSEEEIFKLFNHNYVIPKDRIPMNLNLEKK